MERLNGTSMDIVQDNIEKLKEIFPEIFSEGKIDFKVLEQLLGKEIDSDKERYSFTWHGKTEARKIAQIPSTGTLIPSKEDSKEWDSTNNLYIEGDNLEVLKLLQKSYHSKVKMIYIDPPYNTGKDFVYPDNYKDNLKNYLEITGQLGEEGQKLTTNSDSSGRYHSDWLNMMYPRLKLARNLLTNDGVIFISLDDNEIINLRKICDEIFGEENFVAQLMVVANPGGRDYNQVAVTHEYLLCYGKSELMELNELEKNIEFDMMDIKGGYEARELRNRNPKFHSGNRPNLFYPFYVNPNESDKYGYNPVSLEYSDKFCVEVKPYNSQGKESVWRWGRIKAAENINLKDIGQSQIIARIKKNGDYNIYEKNRKITTKAKSIWNETEMRTENGTREVRAIFGETLFDHPKPLELIKRNLLLGTNVNDNDLILDFFSGSATTAHSIMKLNAEDGGNRKYIMVQLPEPILENSAIVKTEYKNICEIAKDRMRRAGEKIKNDESLPAENREKLDTGFKVFKLNSSNIKTWDPDSKDIAESLFDAINNIKSDRTSLDVLYEILLKYGLDLNIPIENRGSFYSIGGGTLLVNLDEKIEMPVIDAICEEFKFLMDIDEDHKSTVIVRDNGFKNSVDKTNAIQKMKQVGIKEIRSI
ncbi:MAG: site-specific DNA-methyltransferase [Cetobacterium sp.]|uniref:site-specific DNA-methyltransferase n=1 Tax=Cetobacterium sp. TaxID=2071632 RepID=UPI002FC97ADB